METFSEIADERRGLADLLDGLTEEQLAVQSLCDAWTVRDVFAHILMPLTTSMPRVILVMLRHRMSWDPANVDLTARTAREFSTPQIAAGLREQAGNRFTPPRLGPEAPLTDCLVHGQDIRRPLGIERKFPEERMRTVLDFISDPGTREFGSAGRLDGLAFRSTDLDWHSGSGAEVSGPAEAIMMAIAGRDVALADLAGEGAAVMRERFSD